MEPQPSDLVVFEHDKELVLEAFKNGEFDAVEVVSEVAERHFFDFLKSQNLLEELAAKAYPLSVREKITNTRGLLCDT